MNFFCESCPSFGNQSVARSFVCGHSPVPVIASNSYWFRLGDVVTVVPSPPFRSGRSIIRRFVFHDTSIENHHKFLTKQICSKFV